MTQQQIENMFTYHPPFGTQQERYVTLRKLAKAFAENINALCPESNEKEIALRKLQSSVMWANASIALNEHEKERK